MGDLELVRVGEVRLAYRTWGEPGGDTPVLLLHCLGADGADWAVVAPRLAAGRQVIAVDLRGHGASDRPGEYALEAVRDDVAGLAEALGIARAVVIGHSYGGVIAYLLAQARPALVAKLILEDVPALLPQDPPLPVPPPPDGPLTLDWAVKTQFTLARNAPDPRWTEGLATITAPTLVIAGGPASHIPQHEVADLADRIPGARLRTVEAGHLVHEQRPEAFLAVVAEFLGAAR
ncbi:alpha/beta fold hydrolase [Streptomyces pactum]|uniref:Alpha/beta fold hydrolase n=1 Tax=Streptomyces pactum TaxID=68249 RepID=A0ABS0NF95_9ACTN|nr:alpha/beta fold hydrolase [Streptomyces pactum]MBH5333799.1 alpha/beta fold hydrolase [Streptomyces pactum]